MCIQYYSKNRYIISNRNYLDDYSNIKSRKVDMTLSGKYLYKYPKIDLNEIGIDHYPSRQKTEELKELIKTKYNLKKEIIFGSGANGLIQNLVKIFINSKTDNLVTPFYTFNQAEYAVTSFGGITRRVFTDNFNINLEDIKSSIDENTKLIYICNPNNPTGLYISTDRLISFANSIKQPIIVDESGIEFSKKESLLDIKKIPHNLIVIRSFSKAYGLANLRIGYMVCSSQVKKLYKKNVTVNEFSGISIYMAKLMYENDKYVKENIILINKEKEKLTKSLNDMGIDILPSDTNTIMTKSIFSEKFIKLLDENDISIVPIADENGNLHIRIAVQNEETNKKFLEKFELLYKMQ